MNNLEETATVFYVLEPTRSVSGRPAEDAHRPATADDLTDEMVSTAAGVYLYRKIQGDTAKTAMRVALRAMMGEEVDDG